MVDALEHCPSSDENSAAEVEDPQFPGVSSVHVGGNDLRTVPSFYCLDLRVPGLIFSHIVFIAFVQYIRANSAKKGPFVKLLINVYGWIPIFTPCSFHDMRFITDISSVTDSQIMQYFGILNCIAAVYLSWIIKQRGTNELEDHRNMHVNCYDVHVDTQASCHICYATPLHEVILRMFTFYFILPDQFRQ